MFAIVLLAILAPLSTFCHPATSTFHHLVCQQCNAWCSAGQVVPQTLTRVGKAGPRGPVGPRGEPGIVNMTAVEEMIDRKLHDAVGFMSVRSCQHFRSNSANFENKTGGPLGIFIPAIGLKTVYCEVTTGSRDWLVFQRRMDGSVDFNRNWDNYINGFGDVNKEFWLGLETIHQLTKEGEYELRVDMIEHDGNHYYAKYGEFKVGPAWDNYVLTAGQYSGNASNQMNYNNNRPFTTKDADHDSYSKNCGAVYSAGWWFGSCHNANLNGPYAARNGWHGIVWNHPSKILHMRFTEMKFRKRL